MFQDDDASSSGQAAIVDLTIVTVTLNDYNGLDATLRSAAAQAPSGLRIEHVVVDGGSRSNVVRHLRRWEAHDRRWRSEPDDGIYDAMNKGTAIALGGWILFLNGGDTFASEDVLARISPTLLDPLSPDIVSGRTEFVVNGEPTGLLRPVLPGPEGPGLPHQSTFVRRSLLLRYPFDTTLRGAADLDLWLRLKRDGVFSPIYLPNVISRFEIGGVSSGPGRERKRLLERAHVLRRYGLPAPGHFSLHVTATLRAVARRLIGERRFLRMLRLRVSVLRHSTRSGGSRMH